MPVALTGTCPLCSAPLTMRRRRSDNSPFIGCTEYPRCRYTVDYDVALEDLYREIEDLKRAARPQRQQRTTDEKSVLKELRNLLFRFHPDRAGATVSTTDITQELNRALDRLR